MALLETKTGTTDIDELYPSPPLPRVSPVRIREQGMLMRTVICQMRVTSQYDQVTEVPTLEPNCFSMNAEKHLLKPVRSKGW